MRRRKKKSDDALLKEILLQQGVIPFAGFIRRKDKRPGDRRKDISYKLSLAFSFTKTSPLEHGITLLRVAELFELSPAYLSRNLKRLLGENFSSFRNKRRVDETIQWLTKTVISIKQIAGHVGCSRKELYRIFKKQTGYSLKAYRDYYWKYRDYPPRPAKDETESKDLRPKSRK